MRHATEADIPHIVSMARKFHEKTLDTVFSEERFTSVLVQLMMAGCVLVTERGFLVGTTMQNLSDGGITAHEVLWWAEDGMGQAMRREFERWAAEEGCNAVEVSFTAENERVATLLERQGYKPVTHVMRKEI